MPIRPFARVARAQELPGHCVRCPRKDDLFDLGAEGILGFGVVYLCSVCMRDLLDQIGTVTKDEFQAALAVLGEENTRLNAELIGAKSNTDQPAAFLSRKFEEFSRGVDRLSRDLVRDLATGPAGGDRVPEPAAVTPAREAADVPREPADQPAAEPERLSEVPDVASAAVSGDAADADILAALGIAVGAPAGDAGGSVGGDQPAAGNAGGVDAWDVLDDEAAGGPRDDSRGDDPDNGSDRVPASPRRKPSTRK